ncbi:MAG: (2Fe-2S)-binding protein [Proteobacteria bacterium]|nr:(2Fe-2S)-binding protein [Pseudomonadota bacterium]HQR03781.1 (2Fe-2S)-binding protein [Rhodocyclaceae bacterium]
MYVCVCSAVTEKDIAQAAAHGCRSVQDLRLTLGIAVQCGRCAQYARQTLRQSQGSAKEHHQISGCHAAR